MNWVKDYPLIAHRGLHSLELIENTEAAVIAAIESNFAIEVDVQFLSDGRAIVFHDADFLRLFGERTKVVDINPKFVRYLQYSDGQRVLFFEDLLKVVNGKVPLLIEIKNETFSVTSMNLIIDLLKTYKGRFSLQSFNPQIVRHINRKAPHFTVGQLITDWNKTDLSVVKKNILKFAQFFNELSFIAVDKKVISSQSLLLFKLRRVPIITWTVTSKQEIDHLSDRVEGFIFEGFLP